MINQSFTMASHTTLTLHALTFVIFRRHELNRRTILAGAVAATAAVPLLGAGTAQAAAGPAGPTAPRLPEGALEELIAAQLATASSAQDIARIFTTMLLERQPPIRPASTLDLVIAFSFGNRVAADGTTYTGPGPVNAELATVVERVMGEVRPGTPFYVQWEIAQVLSSRGVTGFTTIDEQTGANGQIVYLSTDGVATAALADFAATGAKSGTAGVIGHHDHVGRCALTVDSHTSTSGVTAYAPSGIVMPADYDPDSGQVWTRSAELYLIADELGRLELVAPALEALLTAKAS